jgi:hypothetical protein
MRLLRARLFRGVRRSHKAAQTSGNQPYAQRPRRVPLGKGATPNATALRLSRFLFRNRRSANVIPDAIVIDRLLERTNNHKSASDKLRLDSDRLRLRFDKRCFMVAPQ